MKMEFVLILKNKATGSILMISKTYTLYIGYSYMYVDMSIAGYRHTHMHTQNEWQLHTT